MGSGASARRERELERWKERDLSSQAEHDKQLAEATTSYNEKVKQLQEQTTDLKQQLLQAETTLRTTREELDSEQRKNTALMYSDLPLDLLKDSSASSSAAFSDGKTSLSRTYSMLTVAQCDVVGFAVLSTKLQPQEAITIIDSIQAIIDKTFKHKELFVMDRYSDGCIAASGLVDISNNLTTQSVPPSRSSAMTPLSLADSSYGSQDRLELDEVEDYEDFVKPHQKSSTDKDTKVADHRSPSYYAGLLAMATLNLMSLSAAIKIPPSGGGGRQLQLRVALHSGPCSAGVVGLQTTAGAIRIPHYKLFGPTMTTVRKLCTTSLALQIRVSKLCRDLLIKEGGFMFERCPDFMMWSSSKPIESYWLVGKEGEDLNLPSLDQAVSLSEYEDIDM